MSACATIEATDARAAFGSCESELVWQLAEAVFRESTEKPGFAFVTIPASSFDVEEKEERALQFRRLLVELVDTLSTWYQREYGESLQVLSATRFDQQASTKPHLDAGPKRSVLVLGYEDSEIGSSLALVEYLAFVEERGVDVQTFLEHLPSMDAAEMKLLEAHQSPALSLASGNYYIALINNSALDAESCEGGMRGVLHQADVPAPDASQERLVNSMMLEVAPSTQQPAVSRAKLLDFLSGGSPYIA